jgi:hypothetical protein
MDLAQCLIEPVRVRAICEFLLRIAHAATAEVHDQQACENAKDDEGRNDHVHDFASLRNLILGVAFPARHAQPL